MKKIIFIVTAMAILLFSQENGSNIQSDKNQKSIEELKEQIEIIKNTDKHWAIQNPKNSEWAKRIKQPENCRSFETLDVKLKDIMAVSRNIINEKPENWLKGKYLEYINSQCGLSFALHYADNSKKGFESIVNDYFNQKENPKHSDSKLGYILVMLISTFFTFALIRKRLWGNKK